MCWVIPPASLSMTLALRIASSSRVFVVVDVTHDGHDRRTRLQVLVVLVLDVRGVRGGR